MSATSTNIAAVPPEVSRGLPAWAKEMRDLFQSGSIAQFLIHGNVFDVVAAIGGKMLPLRAFLDDVMFAGYDVVLHYDRGRGIRASKGGDDFGAWLQQALGSESMSRKKRRSFRQN